MTKENEKKPKDVVIHIDKKKYDSPDPTTGAALYTLGGIDASKYELWQEVPGSGDDILIPNNSIMVDLKNGTHFYTVQKDLNPGSYE